MSFLVSSQCWLLPWDRYTTLLCMLSFSAQKTGMHAALLMHAVAKVCINVLMWVCHAGPLGDSACLATLLVGPAKWSPCKVTTVVLLAHGT